jgi:hypothetical protein
MSSTQESGLSLVSFETDLLIVTSVIGQQSSYISVLGLIYEDIIDGLSSSSSSLFHHALLQANEVVHCLDNVSTGT